MDYYKKETKEDKEFIVREPDKRCYRPGNESVRDT